MSNSSVTVAVTVCGSPGWFTAVSGVNAIAVGAPAVHVFCAVSEVSPVSHASLAFVSMHAVIVLTPAVSFENAKSPSPSASVTASPFDGVGVPTPVTTKCTCAPTNGSSN